MIRALLVDDEPKATERLAALLESFPELEVIGTARDVGDAERFLARRTPDVVFLDIDMPGRLGFELVPSVPQESRIVFVTAHESRAVDAFGVGALDYVLKPVDRDRLALTIDRLRNWFSAAPAAAESAGGPEAPQEAVTPLGGAAGSISMTLAGGGGIESIPLADIAWVEGVRNYTRLQIRGRKPAIVRRTLAEWEASLPAPSFGRISRSLIVQPAAIRATRWQSRDQTLVVFEGVADPLPIGRAATARLKELLPR